MIINEGDFFWPNWETVPQWCNICRSGKGFLVCCILVLSISYIIAYIPILLSSTWHLRIWSPISEPFIVICLFISSSRHKFKDTEHYDFCSISLYIWNKDQHNLKNNLAMLKGILTAIWVCQIYHGAACISDFGITRFLEM